jgi:hypothetical protein
MAGRTKRSIPVIALLGLLTAGCGSIEYDTPAPAQLSNSKVIDAPFDQVWARAIPEIGKSFFVIHIIDKGSGILNVGYTGDPETYVDCGEIHSAVDLRKFDFPGAIASQHYVEPGFPPATVDRRLSLEGRANIVFERVSASSTRATVTARYVITMDKVSLGAYGIAVTEHDSIAFNSGERASLPNECTCTPNGRFEGAILFMIH